MSEKDSTERVYMIHFSENLIFSRGSGLIVAVDPHTKKQLVFIFHLDDRYQLWYVSDQRLADGWALVLTMNEPIWCPMQFYDNVLQYNCSLFRNLNGKICYDSFFFLWPGTI